jgi:hypothetical protein
VSLVDRPAEPGAEVMIFKRDVSKAEPDGGDTHVDRPLGSEKPKGKKKPFAGKDEPEPRTEEADLDEDEKDELDEDREAEEPEDEKPEIPERKKPTDKRSKLRQKLMVDGEEPPKKDDPNPTKPKITKGDFPGHPFRGNQYVKVGGGGSGPSGEAGHPFRGNQHVKGLGGDNAPDEGMPGSDWRDQAKRYNKTPADWFKALAEDTGDGVRNQYGFSQDAWRKLTGNTVEAADANWDTDKTAIALTAASSAAKRKALRDRKMAEPPKPAKPKRKSLLDRLLGEKATDLNDSEWWRNSTNSNINWGTLGVRDNPAWWQEGYRGS